jgi:hypothetical protein
MCSQVSQRRVPAFSEHVDTLKRAIVDVAQESFFSFAEFCGPERFAEAIALVPAPMTPTTPRWIAARVDFGGAFAGSVTLTLPYALAADMAAALGGLAPGDSISEALVDDATGEFANMVCGTWLTRACIRRKFDLASPSVTTVPDLAASRTEDEDLLLINEWPVKLAATFVPA